eukprot:scaffold20.g7625.t1
MELLQCPEPAQLGVFKHLESLADAAALASCCKLLHSLSRDARHRRLACAACGHTLCDPAAALAPGSPAQQAPSLVLPDGPAICVAPEHATGIAFGHVHVSHEWHLRCSLALKAQIRPAISPEYDVQVSDLFCGGCGLYVGCRIMKLGSLRAGDEVEDVSQWRSAAVLSLCWLPCSYLRVLRKDGSEDRGLALLEEGGCRRKAGRPRQVFVCAAYRSPLRKPGECRALICTPRDVLSKEHRWDVGAGAEKAYLVNRLAPGAVDVRNEREEVLCQGQMVVADCYCTTCAARIGWKFCKDCEEGRENENQVGRFGLVRRALVKNVAAASPGSA